MKNDYEKERRIEERIKKQGNNKYMKDKSQNLLT